MTAPRTTIKPVAGSAPVVCHVLNKGNHEIGARPSIASAAYTLAIQHGTAARYAPTVTLDNGETRKIVFGKVTSISNEEIHAEGLMPNGNDLVRVTVVFRGAIGNGGTVTVGNPA